jgi:hypothetical protein
MVKERKDVVFKVRFDRQKLETIAKAAKDAGYERLGPFIRDMTMEAITNDYIYGRALEEGNGNRA